MRKRCTQLTAALLCAQSLNSFADIIILSNGDQITASIASIESDTVAAKSPIFGKLTIPVSGIHSIQFKGSFWVRMKGQQSFRFITFDDQSPFYSLNRAKNGGNAKNLCAIAELTTKKPALPAKPRKAAKVTVKTPEPFIGSGVAGSTKTSVITADDLAKAPENVWLYTNHLSGYANLEDIGKQDTKKFTLSASGKHQARNTKNRNTINWTAQNAKTNENTDETYKLDYGYNYFRTDKMFYALNASYSHDDTTTPFKLTTVNAGVGYQFYDSDFLSLSLEAGPGYSIANYRTEASSTSPSVYTKLSYNQKITDVLSVYDDTNFHWLSEENSLKFDGKIGLKYLIRTNLWLELAHNYTWTNIPGDGYEKYNGNMKFGIGMDW